MKSREANRGRLVALLRMAYSGELAAARAYHGHSRSVSDAAHRERIATIEAEEWRHREHVGEMLLALGEHPSRVRELRAAFIGRALAALCRVSGWLLPMYGAGRLESRNVREYENAARFARDCGRIDWSECLLVMAEVEWEHEAYFRSQVLRHPIGRRLPLWPAPAPKSEIRASFEREAARERIDTSVVLREATAPVV